ncbi:MAG: hypothetical protein EBU59_13490, partial [Planctomycetia bacterium]|nr:hypothetical protein [Planctomycetia bacterium]
PQIVGSAGMSGFARDVVVSLDGKYAYVAAQAGGLQIFDVSDPSSPSPVGSLVTDNLSTPANLAVGVTLAADSNYVFVAASGNGLLTVDVSNASAPQQIESFATSGDADSSILSSDGNFLYVTSSNGLQVANITDIGNQTNAGSLAVPSSQGLSLATNGELVYIATGTSGLKSVQLGTYTPEAGLIRFGSEVSGNHTLTVGDANTTGEVEFGGNTAIASLVSAPGNFNVSLTGTNNTLGAANFQHTGVLGIGNDETDRTFVPGGITAPNVSLSQLGGTFATNGSAITFNDISLLANATLDSTNNNLAPAGANVLVSGGLALNSYTLVTKTGTAATQAEGDVTIQNGTVKVEQGSLDIGVGNTSANVTFVENTTITVAAGGQLNVGNGSSLTAGNNTLTLTTDVLNVSPTA